jgi:hypothetical protein
MVLDMPTRLSRHHRCQRLIAAHIIRLALSLLLGGLIVCLSPAAALAAVPSTATLASTQPNRCLAPTLIGNRSLDNEAEQTYENCVATEAAQSTVTITTTTTVPNIIAAQGNVHQQVTNARNQRRVDLALGGGFLVVLLLSCIILAGAIRSGKE